MNLSVLSAAELSALQLQVQQEIKTREQHELASARERIMAIALSAGISLHELFDSQLKAQNRVVKTKVPVRYRHPTEASLQWTELPLKFRLPQVT